jgi:hypothetical protein
MPERAFRRSLWQALHLEHGPSATFLARRSCMENPRSMATVIIDSLYCFLVAIPTPELRGELKALTTPDYDLCRG